MQAVISLLLLPTFNVYTGLLTWNKWAAYTQDKSKALQAGYFAKENGLFLS